MSYTSNGGLIFRTYVKKSNKWPIWKTMDVELEHRFFKGKNNNN